MSRILLLDSGPLTRHPSEDLFGIRSHKPVDAGLPPRRRSRGRGGDCILRNPPGTPTSEKAHRANALDAFVRAEPNRYLPLTDEALRLAAELWAKTRQEGRPTAPPLDLDVDVILAAQALTLRSGSEPVVVTTNPRHLQPFVTAQLWNNIDTGR